MFTLKCKGIGKSTQIKVSIETIGKIINNTERKFLTKLYRLMVGSKTKFGKFLQFVFSLNDIN